jgi:hypothetical protein
MTGFLLKRMKGTIRFVVGIGADLCAWEGTREKPNERPNSEVGDLDRIYKKTGLQRKTFEPDRLVHKKNDVLTFSFTNNTSLLQ